MTDEQELCLACGGPVGRAGRVCDDCLWDTREDDHDDTPLPEARRD